MRVEGLQLDEVSGGISRFIGRDVVEVAAKASMFEIS